MDAMEWDASTFHKIHTEHVCGVEPEVPPGLFLSMKSNREVYIWDEEDYEYEIFSTLSIAHAWTSVILAEKRDSRRHSTTSFRENVVMAGTSYQM